MRDYRIAAVCRSLDILEYLGEQRRAFGLPELSRALGIPKATLFRYLVTLEGRGYVRRAGDGDRFSLGLKILELSNHLLHAMTLHEVALPHMRQLQRRFRETVNLAVLEGCEIVYVEILESPQTFKMSSHVGGREIPHATSLGKAILAFLPLDEVERIVSQTGFPSRTSKTVCSLSQLQAELENVRHRGYAVDNEENEEGARCVGTPIFDHRGNIAAAISVSGPALRSSAEQIEEMGTALLEVASQISQRIGYVAGN